MPRAFDITPSAPKVRVHSGQSGEIAFTVSNKLGRRIRARATPRPDGETQASWLSIPEGAEPELAEDETKLITVQVKLPSSVKDGSYPFHVVVSSLAEPDELYAESDLMQILVTHTERKFPWWIVLLVGGALVIGGGAFGLVKLLGRDKVVPPGKNCVADSDCSGNQRCVEVRIGAKSCLLKPGEKCTGDIQCASAFCRRDENVCSRDDGKCTPETAAQDCRPVAFNCVSGRCLLGAGQRCLDHAECAGDFCQGGVCAPCLVKCGPFLRCHRNQCVPFGLQLQPKVLLEHRRFEGISR
ncbi:MAG TPA: hypothetical protein VFB81_03780 [Myxococcales bacterium]|nr:hypothetical protein [Myxococcales bacterium]